MNWLKVFFVTFIINCYILPNTNQLKKFVIGVHTNEHNSPFGFFSILEGTLNRLIWAKKNNITPVIYWGNDCLYYQPEGYNGSYNVWEYYFEPVSNLRYDIGDQIDKNYVAPDKSRIPYIDKKYDINFHKNVKIFVNKIINENIKIKSPISRKIDSFYKKHFTGKINIGIHLRGTDKGLEATVVNPMTILHKANELSRNLQNNCQFFIATDEEKLLNTAKSFLNNKNIIYYNAHRSIDGRPIHYPRKENAAILGEEVLIDTILLSKCDFFIHTLSNIATFVMFFNPNICNVFIN